VPPSASRRALAAVALLAAAARADDLPLLPAGSVPAGSSPRAACLADLDGLPDIVTADAGSATLSVRSGLGGASFNGLVSFPMGDDARDVHAGDLDGDGRPDVLAAAEDDAEPLTLLVGSGASLVLGPALPSGFAAGGVRLADLDGDGQLDVAASLPADGVVRVWAGDGAGGLAAVPSDHAVGSQPRGLDAADVDLDGVADLAVACAGSGVVSVLRGGPGGLSPAVDHAAGSQPWDVALGDLDADGRADLAVADLAGSAVVGLRGQGDGSFVPAGSFPAGTVTGSVSIGDADGDGMPDVVAANLFSHDVSVLLADVSPFFDLGGAVAGSFGGELVLSAGGDPSPGEVVWLQVDANGGFARGRVPALLVLGIERLDLPYKGGVFVPLPLAVLLVRAGSPVHLRWPAGSPPGGSLYAQAWIGLALPEGMASGSNAVQIVGQAP